MNKQIKQEEIQKYKAQKNKRTKEQKNIRNRKKQMTFKIYLNNKTYK